MKSLETRVETAKEENLLPFTFFRETFDQTASIQRLLQEWELLQTEALQDRNEELQRQIEALKLQRQTEESQRLSDRNNASVDEWPFPKYRNPKGFVVTPPATETKTTPLFIKRDEEHPAVRSLNDAIQASPALQDLKRGISLNDRFLFQRELFHNDREEMNRVIGVLNSFQSYREAEDYLRNNSTWNFDDAIVEEFLWAIEKGFQE